MAGSLTHSDPFARGAAVRAFLDALAGELDAAARPADSATRAALDAFARLVGALDASAPGATSPPSRLAVCRFWGDALAAAPGPLMAPLAALAAWLSWSQNPNYRRRPPAPAFLDNYGYAVIAGPADGPPALVTTPDIA